jgi:PhnB protein
MKKDVKIAENYQTVMPYLILKDAAKFIVFVEKVFNGTGTYKVMRDENTIMHAELMIGECTIMFADATEKYESRPAGLFIYVDNADQTYQKAIESGAEAITEMADQPYGRSGGVQDPFGNSWWVTSIQK